MGCTSDFAIVLVSIVDVVVSVVVINFIVAAVSGGRGLLAILWLAYNGACEHLFIAMGVGIGFIAVSGVFVA